MLIPAHAPILDPSYSYIGSNTNTSNLSTYTFSGESIGTADSSRLVVVLVSAGSGGAEYTLNSATIGGVSATIVGQEPMSNLHSAVIQAVVPTGTTADVVLNWSSTMSQCAISVYSLYNLNSTTATYYDDTEGSAADLTLSSISAAAKSIILGLRTCYRTVDLTCSWSGGVTLTQDSDLYYDGTLNHFSAGLQLSGAVSSISITSTRAGSTAASNIMNIAIWR